MLPLIPDWQERLCEGAPKPLDDRRGPPGSWDWAEEEFGRAELGDARRAKRLLIVARDVYDRPQANIPQACQSRAKTKAAYRLFEHPETTMHHLLLSHYEATLQRVSTEPVVPAVQDTTRLNYSHHPETKGLGPIGSKQEGIVGLELHDTMAFNGEGTPLGLLNVQCLARDPSEFGKKHRRDERPIEGKESHRWLVSFRKTAEAQKRCPNTMFVSVGDREADIYELLQLALTDASWTQTAGASRAGSPVDGGAGAPVGGGGQKAGRRHSTPSRATAREATGSRSPFGSAFRRRGPEAA